MNRSNLWHVLLVCILIMAIGGARVSASFVLGEELPDQACSEIFYTMETPTVIGHFNGTRIAIQTRQYEGEPFDASSTMYVQLTSVREFERKGEGCAPEFAVPIYALNLRDCQCTFSAIHVEQNGTKTTGLEYRIKNCPAPQEQFEFLLSVTTTNVTTTTVYGPTLPGSLYPEVVYTSPYVQGIKSDFFFIESRRIVPSDCDESKKASLNAC